MNNHTRNRYENEEDFSRGRSSQRNESYGDDRRRFERGEYDRASEAGRYQGYQGYQGGNYQGSYQGGGSTYQGGGSFQGGNSSYQGGGSSGYQGGSGYPGAGYQGYGSDDQGRGVFGNGGNYGSGYGGSTQRFGDQSRWGMDSGGSSSRFGQSSGQGSEWNQRSQWGQGGQAQSGHAHWGQERQGSQGSQWGPGMSGRDRGFAGRGPKDYSRSDDRIREELSDRFTDDGWLDASEISVEVKGGEVTLTGTVDDRDQKRRAEDLAEQISGVRDVTNHIRVSRDATPGGNSGSLLSGGSKDKSTPSSAPGTTRR